MTRPVTSCFGSGNVKHLPPLVEMIQLSFCNFIGVGHFFVGCVFFINVLIRDIGVCQDPESTIGNGSKLRYLTPAILKNNIWTDVLH